MNFNVSVVSLGADPEEIQLGEKTGMKLRCAEKARGKKSVTRWFNAIVTGYDADDAKKLRKGDKLVIMGEMAKTEYKPKKPRYKGEMGNSDEMSFAKILVIIKSPTFFADDESAEDGEGAETGDVTTTDAPDLGADDPLAGIA